ECSFKLERRHDRRQTFREHRLARTRWTNQQNVVPHCNRDFQSSLRRHLSTYFFEIDTVMPGLSQDRVDVDLHRLGRCRGTELLNKTPSAAESHNRIDI